MKILMLSGIFGQTPEYRASHLAETPETLLADGLIEAGVDVTTAPPHFHGDWRGFDVVHLNHLTNACMRALLPSRNRIVFTHHTSGWKPWHHRAALRAIEHRADRVVVFTEDERQRLGGRVPDDRVAVIRSALAVDRFELVRHRPPAPGEPWDLLFVGRLVHVKRVHLALEFLRRVIQSGDQARLRVISHHEALRSELEAEARRLGVEHAVHYLGARTRDEIGPEMARSHLLLLPSYREALSTVTSEAALCGLPVHLFDVSGADEQVPQGWQRPHPDDIEGWIRLGLQRLDDYAASAEAFWENSGTVRRRLGLDRAVREHIDLYREVTAA